MYLDIPNYHLTFSRAENEFNIVWSRQFLKEGKNVAVVTSPEIYNTLLIDHLYYNGRKINTVDGDSNDLRFLDPMESLIVLKAKGDAKKDKTGFTVNDLNEL